MLPNLSDLSLSTGVKLFDYLAQSKCGKSKLCYQSGQSLTPVDRASKPSELGENATEEQKEKYSYEMGKYYDYVEYVRRTSSAADCDIDGYMMYKVVPGGSWVGKWLQHLGKPLELTLNGEAITLPNLSNRSVDYKERYRYFSDTHSVWVRDQFSSVCSRGALGDVSWGVYGYELATMTDWYYLLDDGPQHLGHLFLRLVDHKTTNDRVVDSHFPSAGVFGNRYLYVALVCTSTGDGKLLMSIAEEACRKLGCYGIALASLTNSAGVYYNMGYHFATNNTGMLLDVKQWTQVVNRKDGTPQTRLQPEYDVYIPKFDDASRVSTYLPKKTTVFHPSGGIRKNRLGNNRKNGTRATAESVHDTAISQLSFLIQDQTPSSQTTIS